MTEPANSPAEADRLTAEIRRLEAENTALREGQSPAAGALDLQAENVLLRREAEMLRVSLPEFTPFEGPLPETLAELKALPAAHRRQILSDRPDHVRRLQDSEALVRDADRLASREADRRESLGEAGVSTLDEFANMSADRRRQLAAEMTPRQRRALLGHGDANNPPAAGYL